MSARRPHPPISDRDWLTEKETAARIGCGHSTRTAIPVSGVQSTRRNGCCVSKLT